MTTNVVWLGRGIIMKTRKELMQELNELLNVSYNWSRLNSLDLERLVDAVEKLTCKDRSFHRVTYIRK